MIVREVAFPGEIPVDPDKTTKAIFVHADQGLFAPHSMAESFRRVNETYLSDRRERFRSMAASVLKLEDIGLDMALIQADQDANAKDLLVVLSPLNDGKPQSGSDIVTDFVIGSGASKQKAKPNSWRPVAKLAGDYEFGNAEGMGMPRLQVFAPEAGAMTTEQRERVRADDMRPYGELALRSVQEAEKVKHEKFGTGGYERLHFFAAGMGAKALGAAVHALESGNHQVGSVTLMNFALGEQSDLKLARDYAGRRMIGEASQLLLPKDYIRVPELQMLTELDKDGAEFGMRVRQARAIARFRMVRAIMNAQHGVDYIEKLLAGGSTITVANGVNESIVETTDHYLPIGDGGLYRTDIVGVDGKKVGQMANEHGAALAVVSNLGLYNHRTRRAVT